MSSSDSAPPPPPSPHDKARRTRRSKDSRESKRLSRELVKLLLFEERESNDLQQMLMQMTEQLKLERQRADDAEAKVNEAVAHMKNINAARLAALRDATEANKELSLYKAQLVTAQNEINRAQSVLSALEAQKHEAESDAARARTTARQLRQEKLIADAKEEGRRIGLQEGLDKGRQIGYERGRATGYAHGRSSAERARTTSVMGDDSRPPSPDSYRPPPRNPVTQPRRSPIQASPLEPRNAPPVINRPLSTTSPGQRDHIIPIPIHNVSPPPRHSAVDIPPDNWIPQLDEDNRIRLPPPHELMQELSPLLDPLPQLPMVSEDEPALMIPAPALPRVESPQLVPRSNSSTPLHRPTRRRNSSESGSTTISQLDMLNEPSNLVARANPSSPLSVIQEVVSGPTSPRTTASQATSRKGSSPQLREILTPAQNPVIPNLEEYLPTRISIVSSDSSNGTRLHPRILEDRRRSESSISTSIGITVEPPSRPLSGSSVAAETQPYGGFLSPADANRPVPLPEQTRETPAVIPNVLSMTTSLTSGSSGPIILPDDQLPLGFVPSGSFTPSHSSVPLSPLSGVIPAMSSTNGFLAGGVGPMMNEGSGRVSRGSRRPAPDSDDSSTSGSSSTDTLRTPPGRKRGASNIPPNPDIVIPVPVPEPEAVARPAVSRSKAGRRGRGRR